MKKKKNKVSGKALNINSNIVGTQVMLTNGAWAGQTGTIVNAYGRIADVYFKSGAVKSFDVSRLVPRDPLKLAPPITIPVTTSPAYTWQTSPSPTWSITASGYATSSIGAMPSSYTLKLDGTLEDAYNIKEEPVIKEKGVNITRRSAPWKL